MVEDKIIKYENKSDNQEFPTLESSVHFYRTQTDYKFPKKSYILMMLDGKKFSTKVKKKFKLPFDDDFIKIMNETAIHLCKNVSGTKIAFVQSDEISLYITDIINENTSPVFDFRMCKMQSIIAAYATSYFNRAYQNLLIKNSKTFDDFKEKFNNAPLFEFDAKVWTVPDESEAYKWMLYRQNDCIRNSKSQAAQTYLSHNQLMKKNTEEQIELLYQEKGIKWSDYPADQKFGRLVHKIKEQFTKTINGQEITYDRSIWIADAAPVLNTLDGKEFYYKTIQNVEN